MIEVKSAPKKAKMDLSQYIEQDTLSEQLMRAVNQQNLTQVRALTPQIQIQDVRDSNEDTLVHMAVRKKNVEILEHILSIGSININSFNELGQTPLLLAAIESDPSITKLITEKSPDLNLSDFEGNTPLHYATYYNLQQNCVLLLEKGAHVNAQNKRGLAPLHVVCGVRRDLELVAILIHYGADANLKSWDENWYTPFELCLVHGKEHFIEFLLDFVIFDADFSLGAITGAMEYQSEFFPLIAAKVSEVTFGDNALIVFLDKTLQFKPEHLRIFFDNFEYVVKGVSNVDDFVRNLFEFLDEYLSNSPDTATEASENLLIILSEPLVSCFIDSINKFESGALSALVQVYRKHKHNLWCQIILHLLSYGAELTDKVLDQIYDVFGDGEFFRTLLHMDIIKLFVYPEKPPFPAVIYDVNIKNINEFLQKPILFDFAAFDKILDFFASGQIRDLCANHVGKVAKMLDVPLLLELARNASRNHIVNFYGVRSSRQFHTVLQVLPICENYKDIIVFKRKLYCLS